MKQGVLLTIMALLFAWPAMAQDIANSACDPAYYKKLESRAWLEAQREITQNQNLISKPDSVLAYSCFDDFVGTTVREAAAIFSQNKDFGLGAGQDVTNNAVTNAVLAPTAMFMANFKHGFRGGRNGGSGYEFQNSIDKTGPYNCMVMNDIWENAKCANFAEKDHDKFFTFSKYTEGPDKRKLPTVCPPTANLFEAELKNIQ